MARKTTILEIHEEGSRDDFKRYLITEMPATKGEKWGARALNALLASGIEMPDSVASGGLRGLAIAGAQGLSGFSGIPWDLLEPLLDEMMSCVQVMPDPNKATVVRPLIESDVEEIKTRLLLRNAWLELHIGFSFTAKSQTSDSAVGASVPSST